MSLILIISPHKLTDFQFSHNCVILFSFGEDKQIVNTNCVHSLRVCPRLEERCHDILQNGGKTYMEIISLFKSYRL